MFWYVKVKKWSWFAIVAFINNVCKIKSLMTPNSERYETEKYASSFETNWICDYYYTENSEQRSFSNA